MDLGKSILISSVIVSASIFATNLYKLDNKFRINTLTGEVAWCNNNYCKVVEIRNKEE